MTKPKRPPPVHLDRYSAITAETMSELLCKARLPRLGPEAADNFARALEGVREFSRVDESLASVNAAKRKTSLALDCVIDAFDELQREEQKFLDGAEQGLVAMPDWTHGPATIRAKRDHVAEIDRLKDLVHDIKRSERLKEWEYGARKWIRYAPDVLAAFSAAMSSVGKKYRLGNGGPVGRFFEAVVPLLTGETPTAESVTTQLKEERTRASNREF